jgi:23S rRNA (cytidine1920-2'-O)/16S rRNA (cytidine1409-2'-O)-methyltransferase
VSIYVRIEDMQKKNRLDVILTELGLVESRTLAQRLIMAGQVRVEGQMEMRPSARVSPEAKIEIDQGQRFVSRGGEKLEAAIEAFHPPVDGSVCADLGASTGGFTDCLLQHGAAKVYAIDVGYGVLHWKLRNHPKVISMERTNGRYLEHLPETASLVSIDASFISLKLLLPVVIKWLPEGGGDVIALIKPQFEAGRAEVDRGDGVILDEAVHRQVLTDVLNFSVTAGYAIRGLIRSPLKGPKGNSEFLVHLVYPAGASLPLGDLIDGVFPSAAEAQD